MVGVTTDNWCRVGVEAASSKVLEASIALVGGSRPTASEEENNLLGRRERTLSLVPSLVASMKLARDDLRID